LVTKKIAMTSFADFVAGTESSKARILKGYKYPNDEGMAMAKYYLPTKSAISDFHENKYNRQWLIEKAVELQESALTPSSSLRTKLLNNSRSIKSYAEHFSDHHYNILENVKFPFTLGGVTINVTPDLHVEDGGVERYFKFSFTKKKLKFDYVRTIVACMSYGLNVHQAVNQPDAVALIDVPSGIVHSGVKITDAIVEELSKSCSNLTETWDLL